MQVKQPLSLKMLPKDIQKHIKKKILFKWVCRILAFLILATIDALLFWSSRTLIGDMHIILKIFFYVAFIILPFWLSGVPHKLIDKSWKGKILDVSVATATEASNEFGYRPRLYRKNKIVLKIEREDGKILVKKTAGYPVADETRGMGYFSKSKTSGDINKKADNYNIGDDVYHFYGLENLVVLSNSSDSIDCIVCSATNPKTRDDCFLCGHSLIKSGTLNSHNRM